MNKSKTGWKKLSKKNKIIPKGVDRESYLNHPENFRIPKNKIPEPTNLNPWWFRNLKSGKFRVYDDKDDIKQALIKSIKKEYPYFGFKSWKKAQTGDTGFTDEMYKHLKKPKHFETGTEAYEYIVSKYPKLSKNYKILIDW